MSLFGKGKTEDKKKGEGKSAKVVSGKKAKPEAKKSMKDLYSAGKESVSPVAEGKNSSAKTAEGGTEAKRDLSASAAYRVLIRPLVTEKGSHLGAENKYLFEVDPLANKVEVAKAVESAFGIKPVKVNIMKMAGKKVRRGRVAGRRKNWKKAIVTLPEGKAIQVYEGI